MSESSVAARNRRLTLRRRAKVNVKVTCRNGGLDLGVNIGVAVLDVSESGVRLLLREAVALGQEVSVSLEAPQHRRPILRLANVVWALPAEGGYCAGVNFQKWLPYKDIFLLTNL